MVVTIYIYVKNDDFWQQFDISVVAYTVDYESDDPGSIQGSRFRFSIQLKSERT